MIQKKPYKIRPKLIEQPTWGGNYISTFKNLHLGSEKKIGQSYELFSESKLQVNKESVMSITDINSKYSFDFLGPNTVGVYGKMPLLIKFTQSLGNSFQLHVREEDRCDKWKPKPETWYFFEEGFMTLGINPKTDVEEYKNACLTMEIFMKKLSEKIQTGKLPIIDAKKQADEYIKKINPWQFVNIRKAEKGLIADLSTGGIHHSWEADPVSLPLGNILYEVQLDVDDASSTLRSFDKGKILDNGSLRPLTIQDYFKFIDTSPENNLISNILRKKNNGRIIKTKHYCLDEISISKQKKEFIEDSFVHLFVKEGSVTVSGSEGELLMQRGDSCFVPFFIKSYSITPNNSSATMLKTHILY